MVAGFWAGYGLWAGYEVYYFYQVFTSFTDNIIFPAINIMLVTKCWVTVSSIIVE